VVSLAVKKSQKSQPRRNLRLKQRQRKLRRSLLVKNLLLNRKKKKSLLSLRKRLCQQKMFSELKHFSKSKKLKSTT